PQPMRKLARIPFGPRILGDGRLPAMSPVRCSSTGSFLSPGSRRRGRARSVAHVAFELAVGPGQRLLQRLAVEVADGHLALQARGIDLLGDLVRSGSGR